MSSDPEVSPTPNARSYAPRYELKFGPQLVAVYFGARDCGFCMQPAFKSAIRRLGTALATQAAAAGRTFHFLAVAVDWDAAEGVEYLRQLGEFDEISTGGKWLNTAVAQRLFLDGRAGVPTLVLYERTITAVPENDTLVFSPERELARFADAKRIAEWVELGAPIAGLLSAVRDSIDRAARQESSFHSDHCDRIHASRPARRHQCRRGCDNYEKPGHNHVKCRLGRAHPV